MKRSIELIVNRTAIFFSFVCLVHCVLTPFILLFLTVYGITKYENKIFEVILVIFMIVFSSITVFSNFRHHKKIFILAFHVTFLCFIIFSQFIPDQIFEIIFMTIGSIGIIVIQQISHRFCKNHNH